MRQLALLPLVLGAGCAAEEEPYWALDPLWTEVDSQTLYGFQTWELFARPWGRTGKAKHYLCAVVVELEAEAREPDPSCTGCSQAWAVQPSLLESDCDPQLAEDLRFLSLRGLAVGPVEEELVEADPYPEASLGGRADYGAGWEPHGWVYPATWDVEGSPQSPWDIEQQLIWWPAYAWELSPSEP